MVLNNAVQIINDARHELSVVGLSIARNQQNGLNATDEQKELIAKNLQIFTTLKILDRIVEINDDGEITQILGDYDNVKLNRILLSLRKSAGKTRPILPGILNPLILTPSGVLPGATGASGASVYLYIGYADDNLGNGYSASPTGKDYIAFRTSSSPITTLNASSFAGLWRQYVGASGGAGSNGSDGQSQYVFQAWADDNSGTNFTLTFDAGKAYTAFLVKNNTTPPVQADYSGLWGKYLGDDGATGSAGADGANAFVYIAYADADDGTGFTLTFDANKDYVAILGTDTEIVSPVQGDFSGLWKNYKGADGTAGTNGSNGADGSGAFLYIAYADDAAGNGFSLTDNTKDYIAFKGTTTEIVSPVVTDFTGLWRKYRGDGDKYRTSSSTSLTIGTGTAYFLVEKNLAYSTGQRFVIATPNNPANRMEGTVIYYDAGDGQFQGDVDTVYGSGTFSVWDVNLAAAPGSVAGQNAYYAMIATDQGSGGSAQTLTAGPDKITQFDAVVSQSPGMTASVATDNITVANNGAYAVDFNARVSNSTSVAVLFQLYINDVAVDNMIDEVTFSGATEAVHIHGILENVQQDDVFDIRVTPASGTPDLLVEQGRLSVYTIGFLQSEQFRDFENADVDTGTETVDSFAASSGNAVKFEVVIIKGTNFKQSTILAVWDGTNPPEKSEIGPVVIGTVDVTLDVDFSGGDIRLRATATSDDWIVRGKRTIVG